MAKVDTDAGPESVNIGVRAIDITRFVRRRRWRQAAQLVWGFLFLFVPGTICTELVLRASRGSIGLYGLAALGAIAVVISAAGVWMVSGLGRARRHAALVAVFSAPVFSLICVVSSLLLVVPHYGVERTPLISRVLSASLLMAIGVVLLPSSISVLRSLRLRDRSESDSADASVASLIFPLKRIKDLLFPTGDVPRLGLTLYLLNISLSLLLAFKILFPLPLAWRMGLTIPGALLAVIFSRRFLIARTRDIKTALATDSRPPVLYLRSFSADRDAVWRLYGPSLLEGFALRRAFAEFIARVIGSVGPVIAIGEPGKPTSTIGIAHENFSNDEWQAQALGLMDRAGLIVILAGRSGGVRWEMEQLMATGQLGKTVVLLPRQRGPEWTEAWTEMCDVFGDNVTTGLAAARAPSGTVALLPSTASRVTVISVNRADVPHNYELAVRAAIELTKEDLGQAREPQQSHQRERLYTKAESQKPRRRLERLRSGPATLAAAAALVVVGVIAAIAIATSSPSNDVHVPVSGRGTSRSVAAIASDGAVVVLDDGSIYSVGSADQSTHLFWPTGAPVAAAKARDSLTNLSNGERVTAKFVGKSSDANPYLNAGDHTQNTNSGDGSIIVLDDGSIWAVPAASDQAAASTWPDGASITVNETSSGTRYGLVNTDDQATVHANYIGNE